jgi:hypothetical protein
MRFVPECQTWGGADGVPAPALQWSGMCECVCGPGGARMCCDSVYV